MTSNRTHPSRFWPAGLFTAHPASVGESYVEHMRAAASFAASMVIGGAACAVHALLPFAFKTTASRRIEHLFDRMVTNRKRVQGLMKSGPAAVASVRDDVVLVVGGGYSGSLLAINLLRHGGPKAILLERDPAIVGRGTAYGKAQPEHVLNVRATNMSAFADDPDHFIRWLCAGQHPAPDGFATRALYGRYLKELLDDACRATPGRLEIVTGSVEDVSPLGNRCVATLSDGRSIACDQVVLATGNLPPPPMPRCDTLNPALYLADPWSAPVAGGALSADDTILLLGTGLTAVDVALTLESGGFGGRIVCLSRRGLAPHHHQVTDTVSYRGDRPWFNGASLVREVRHRASQVGWRMAVDELRPHTQDLWRRASPQARKRYLRHLRPYWDIHRHRIAPAVAERIGAMRAAGRLEFTAGKITSIRQEGGLAAVTWRIRGTDDLRSLSVARIVNCTGPEGDLNRTTDPLLVRLRDRGIIRPDPLNLGIDVDAGGRVIGRDGHPSPGIHAVGPMTRGEAWEIIAVPDIRRQVWDMARRLSAAHWVGGEGL